MNKYYLTTPLYYVNAAPHLGHAYSTLVADTIRRFRKMQGYDAFLLTGTDEHGQNIDRIARERNISPQQQSDETSELFRSLWERLGISYDSYIRTTDERHRDGVLALWSRLVQAKTPDGEPVIYSDKYSGWYCQRCESFKEETDLRQPDNVCPDHDQPCQWTEEENLFFRLSAYQDALLALYEEQPGFLRPETRRNEVASFVRSGLRDISISRSSLKWGIQVPDATQIAGAEAQHVFYVWLDALTGYMSGIGFGQSGKAAALYEKLWPVDLHLVGKEIVRFHAVYWPAFLMAAGLPLPRGIFAHGWLLFEEGKMSKSRGNIIRPDPIREVLGTDALRYFLLREIPFGQDGHFSYDSLLTRYNADLANDFGNLASRVLTMITRYFGGQIPYPSPLQRRPSADLRILELAAGVSIRYQEAFDRLEFGAGLDAVWELVSALNKYLVETEPWRVAEGETDEDRARLGTILYTTVESLRLVTGLLYPVLPESTEKIWRQLGQSSDLSSLTFDELITSPMTVSDRIGNVEPVFPRVIKAEALKKIQDLEDQLVPPPLPAPAAGSSDSPQPVAPERLPIDDFLKWDIRVGEVRVAERIKGATKLLRLEVDIGTEVRQILVGIAEYYEPEALVGRKVVILANLQPRKMRGLLSEGMLLAASVGKEDRPVLASFLEEVPNGARLR